MKTNVNVRIMDSDFPLMCDIEEKEVLLKSAEMLNHHLKAFRRKNPSVEAEKVFIMGALRATCELMTEIATLSDQAKVANAEMAKTLADLKS